jgi:predicted DNA-binding transcriptional regulator YafY
MEALGSAGVPVYAERGAQGGWKLMEGYRTDWAGWNREEILSLLAARPHRHLNDLGWSAKFEAALLKLLASLSPTLRRDAEDMRERLYVDGTGWHPGGEDVPLLPLLQEAIWAGRQLRIEYSSNSGKTGPRTVHPLGLVLKGTLWYLVAIPAEAVVTESADIGTGSAVDAGADTEGKAGAKTWMKTDGKAEAKTGVKSEAKTAPSNDREPRSYRASRIRAAELLLEPAERPVGFRLAAYWERSVSSFRSRLPRYPAQARVREDARARIERTPFVRVISWGERSADGLWRQAALEFDTLESARDIVLGFGARLLILEPAELRDAVAATANEVMELYSDRTISDSTTRSCHGQP